MEKSEVYTHSYTLTAGESNAQGRMPVTLVGERVIEVATEHANALGIGYAALITKNIGWVLSRLSIEMYHYPVINENYKLETWIEGYNRHFSNRNFRMTDSEGNVIGYMRTVWVAMDFASRSIADISSFERESFPIADVECPIERTPRLRIPAGENAVRSDYTFKYCDIDFNRHVNTIRYLDLILNHWSLDHYDSHSVARLDVLFHHECHFGQTVELLIDEKDGIAECSIVTPEHAAVNAMIRWQEVQPELPAEC